MAHSAVAAGKVRLVDHLRLAAVLALDAQEQRRQVSERL
jgi:hypothetical protein